jgi:hypothetical protein
MEWQLYFGSFTVLVGKKVELSAQRFVTECHSSSVLSWIRLSPGTIIFALLNNMGADTVHGSISV